MDDLVTWLRAQIDEDEQDHADSERGSRCEARGIHLWPDRARAEVGAKRRILDELEVMLGGDPYQEGRHAVTLLKLLALPYEKRPGYREE